MYKNYKIWLNQAQILRNGYTKKEVRRRAYFKLFKLLFKKYYLYRAKQHSIDWKNIYYGAKTGLVSIVLPVYNQANLLEKSIISLLDQSYRNFELIIVNDGSTDGVERILDKYQNDPRILILTQKNRKLPSALNTGFSHAKGEFFSWTSADNIMLPDQLTEQVKFLMGNDFIQMVYCNYELIDEKDNPYIAHSGTNFVNTDQDIELLNYTYNFINACFLYRSNITRIIGNYDPAMYGIEDYDYWLRIKNSFTIQHIEKKRPFYRYRVHDNTILNREGKRKIGEGLKKAQRLDRHRRLFFQLPLTYYIPQKTFQKFYWQNEKGVRFIPFETENILEIFLAYSRINQKNVLFLTNNKIRQSKYLSIVKHYKQERLLFVFGILTGNSIENLKVDFDVLDFFIVDTRELYNNFCYRYKDRLLCIPMWHNYMKLFKVIANHYLFYKKNNKLNFNKPPCHQIYRS